MNRSLLTIPVSLLFLLVSCSSPAKNPTSPEVAKGSIVVEQKATTDTSKATQPDTPQTTSEKTSLSGMPFTMNVFVKKAGGEGYRPFVADKDAVQKDDEIQVELHMNRTAYVAVFYRSNDRKVYTAFPEENQSTMQEVKAGTTVKIPSQGGLILDDQAGQDAICCFYSDKQDNCSSITMWLETAKLEKKEGARAVADAMDIDSGVIPAFETVHIQHK